MHDRRREIEDRVTRAMEQRIVPCLHTLLADLSLEVWHVPPARDGFVGEPVPFAEAVQATYLPARVGDSWGPAWGTSWFHLTGEVPTDCASPEIVLDLGWSATRAGMQAEGLVFRADGTHVKGLNPRNTWIPCNAGETIDLYVEAVANPTLQGIPRYWPTTEGDRLTASSRPLYKVVAAGLCEHNLDVRALHADIDVLDGLMRALPENDARRWEILYALERALDALDYQDVIGTAAAAREELAPALHLQARGSAHTISAIGHAHIDSAWLWPVRETVRKVARTVANVVNLLDTTDDLVHAMSSAQQWAWLEEHQPGLFSRALEHVRGGRLVPVGGMWVESDTNMVGGEAVARQFVYGKRYMIDKLGVDPQEVWLPDSFGYTAALPQIVKLAGFRWFLTQKISWNTVNKFPHHTFQWEGIDGTRVFTHFPPADTYNGQLSGAELAKASGGFRDKGAASRSLLPFGYGDGGGGPTREMLDRARRTRDLEGSPRVTIESPRAFFEAAEAEYPSPPVWTGELYLEIHRGTYTSQAKTKQGNRRCEHLLREAELWCATAATRGLVDYPYDELRKAWETVLLNQFHDILPGSSIAWVHREATDQYAEVAAELEGLITNVISALAGSGESTVRFNAAPMQLGLLPPMAGSTVMAKLGGTTVEGLTLDNGLLRVTLDDQGVVRSVRDVTTDREVLPPGGGANLLQLHPDTPNSWDAWDIDSFYRNVAKSLTQGKVSIEGETVMVTRSFGSSTVTQWITLRPGASQVDFETEVDWHEREKVLKVAFDLDVHTDRARYETQFGHVVRPTHENTTWDAARFEVCAHRWVLVEEQGYGVAVANDSTYGHDVTRHVREGGGTSSTVRLTLLRAPRYPDPQTDQGRHTFRYALVPAAGVAEAAAAGYALNLPPREARGSDVEPLVRVDGPAYVEAVKLAEDGSGDLIVRLYEPFGARAQVTVVVSFEVTKAEEVDLVERPLRLLENLGFELRPFQILTLRLSRSD
jgi:alpha-mannosidase